jgi:hypothetical protein
MKANIRLAMDTRCAAKIDMHTSSASVCLTNVSHCAKLEKVEKFVAENNRRLPSTQKSGRGVDPNEYQEDASKSKR